MELEQRAQSGPGLCGSDREVFERVWRRVTQTGGAESPVEAIPAGEYLPAAPVPVQYLSSTIEVRRVEESAPACLGEASAGHGEELQRFIREELSDAATYAALARRTKGRASSRFAALSADEKRHAKRLSAAYFLISGVRYFPADRASPRLEGTYMNTLRARFQAEQMGEARYRAAAGRSQDPCLRELYLELAMEENAHSWTLREILEDI